MPKSPELSEDSAVSLSRAWLEFADISRPGRKDDYYKIKWAMADAMGDEFETSQRRFYSKMDKLRIELLGEIRSDKLAVYGRDLSKGVNSPHEKMPGSYFDEMHGYFKADWDNDTVTIHGQKFADVVIVPVCSEQNSNNSTTPSKMGRPTSQGIEEAIQALIAEDPDFKGLGRKRQCDLVRIHLFGDGVDNSNPPKNYKDGAIKNRLRDLLPS
jgi:hypothetical protein